MLYQNSLVNVLTCCGPALFSVFVESSKTIFFDYGTGGFDGNLAYYEKEGVSKYEQPYLPLGGYIIWNSKRSAYSSKDLNNAYKKINDYSNIGKYY